MNHADADEDSSKANAQHLSDYVFGSRKRRRISEVPFPATCFDGFTTDTVKALKLDMSEECVSMNVNMTVLSVT